MCVCGRRVFLFCFNYFFTKTQSRCVLQFAPLLIILDYCLRYIGCAEAAFFKVCSLWLKESEYGQNSLSTMMHIVRIYHTFPIPWVGLFSALLASTWIWNRHVQLLWIFCWSFSKLSAFRLPSLSFLYFQLSWFLNPQILLSLSYNTYLKVKLWILILKYCCYKSVKLGKNM